ncbi:sigma-54-dependent transcriptional regulator [Marinobacter halophilus]|uniref:Sigma-54-dependent Fis family transcriptional regulator n=1 Tax=Marinobacter halophilus TaxID=1323740 RepID=A0A2T1KEZ0_9GAMM|nr:sigma-54 dependent transcriptional regulator [Marinobacter halophilus]PSF08699.1 sigma-54-dependent Fis family transcriptional regulator [Marinobacter halophilus]GGC63002.1 sigma-54-dependent Fis family transcriptional regulator [Marinobacter halophilus]
MEQKRPLVLLSADSAMGAGALSVCPEWQLARINALESPTGLPPEWDEKPVGICTLTAKDLPHLEQIRNWLECLPVASWLALTHRAQLSHPEVCRLIQHYCHDYHTLPVDQNRLNSSLGHMLGMSRLGSSLPESHSASYQRYVMGGQSPAIRRARSLLRRFAATSEPILICGESGTGKEAAARFAHQHSSRRHQPLITVNCAALPASLIHSELFGHQRGAFTHALQARKGRIEAADGGTLVLSGADELSLEQQSAMLRFLQEGQIEPVGASHPIRVDVRVIAISGKPLEYSVNQGTFRSDVFYRLGNLSVTMPPLTNRLEDLPYLAQCIVDACGKKSWRPGKNTLIAMARHPWPGNLRELQNRLHQGLVMTQTPPLQPEDLGLPPALLVPSDDRFSLEAFRARADEEAIAVSLALTRQNLSAAARLLKISRVSFYRLLAKHKLPLPNHLHAGSEKGNTP